ncbi:UNVERIFIED_CONTAM: Type I inositol polyphosphate 5-phosphatase 2 [Sesamum radiatum]|uniref:Type I inositol polyphosphate 5-phosphatase 2 n=1 Tax=Sesamum radiatum TaxID=300843 RepID=A0AAW2TXW0_SESRA
MKARRGKRSEPFWPSIVMKKWLNIKPKVYDFSEDEVDTESEDDGKPLKDYSVRHRRGKSETLRLQYINTKDVRVTIGTWNVAGRLPNDNLEIDDWLCMQEPADIYILGFQEVVPLNAGNVFGAENRRPIPKWEAIIRRTLNKSLEPDTKHKSYSAPPSPVFRTSSASDILADATDTPVLDIFGEDSIGTIVGCDPEITSMRKNISLKKIYNVDWDNRLDWPEQSLDATSQPLSSRSTLRRVLSSSARIGSTWMSNALISSPQNIPLSGSGLKRMHRSSGNLGLIHMDQEDELEVLDSLSDELDQSSGEEEDSFVEMTDIRHENALSSDAVKSHPTYVRIVSKQMVGIYVSVWVRRRLRRHINNLKVSPVGIGLMGYMGNKVVFPSFFSPDLSFVVLGPPVEVAFI